MLTKDEIRFQMEDYYNERNAELLCNFEMGYLTKKELMYQQKQNKEELLYALEDLERHFDGRPSQAREKAIKDQMEWDDLVRAADESYARWLEIEEELRKI